MALWDNPPHRVTVYTGAASRDLGGGTKITYSAGQAAVPCSINTAGATEVEFYARQDILVSHTVAFLASTLTTVLVEGMKLVTDDRSESFEIVGIRRGRAYGSIPALFYADCRQAL